MSAKDTITRGANTLGLAAWFGGSLMGAVSLRDLDSSGGVGAENEAWRRWSTVQNVAVASHLLGSVGVAWSNKGRLATQRGVERVSAAKVALTAGALGATVAASVFGRQLHEHDRTRGNTAKESRSPVDPDRGDAQTGGSDRDDGERAELLRRLRAVQIAVPALTGLMLVADVRLGEQQRPSQVLKGEVARVMPDLGTRLPDRSSVTEAFHKLPELLASIPDAISPVTDALSDLPDAVRSIPESLPTDAITDAVTAAARQVPGRARQLIER